jgi:hypothetical protein
LIEDDYKLLIKEHKDNFLLSLRLGVLKVDELRYLMEHFQEEENYEACQGLSNAYVLFKEELDEY